MTRVQCRNCANFVVIHSETGQRVEANSELRRTGKHIFLNNQGVKRQYVPIPVCHVGRRRDWLDFEPTDEPDKILSNIGLEVYCDDFRVYEPGRGPRELDEMNSHQATIQVQRDLLALQQTVFEWRQQQADNDEKLTMRIQALEQVRHNENLGVSESDASANNWQAVTSIIALVFSAITLLILILDKMYGK